MGQYGRPNLALAGLLVHHSLLLLNLKSTKFCQTVQTSNPILLLFLPGFLRNVHLYLFITNMFNLSLTSGQFYPIPKESVISPLLKKPTLDKDQLSDYLPVSNLSLKSKLIERVVKFRLVK